MIITLVISWLLMLNKVIKFIESLSTLRSWRCVIPCFTCLKTILRNRLWMTSSVDLQGYRPRIHSPSWIKTPTISFSTMQNSVLKKPSKCNSRIWTTLLRNFRARESLKYPKRRIKSDHSQDWIQIPSSIHSAQTYFWLLSLQRQFSRKETFLRNTLSDKIFLQCFPKIRSIK